MDEAVCSVVYHHSTLQHHVFHGRISFSALKGFGFFPLNLLNIEEKNQLIHWNVSVVVQCLNANLGICTDMISFLLILKFFKTQTIKHNVIYVFTDF